MLKQERLERIEKLLQTHKTVQVQDIMTELGVSDMTVRRYLDELEKEGKLVRVRGGAQAVDYSIDHELTHVEKSVMHMDQKLEAAKAAASLIQAHDTIYIGPGTTMELLADQINTFPIRVITNSLPVFEVMKKKDPDSCILIGGRYRRTTDCFTGVLTNSILEKINVAKAFISCNGIVSDKITTSSLEEGEAQRIALENAKYRFLVVDESKFNRDDFYTYYRLYHFTALICDNQVSDQTLEPYADTVKICKAAVLLNEMEKRKEEEHEKYDL